MESVEEYIDFMLDKLNKLAIEDISYSDYDQMTDWLGEIRKQVKRLEKKQEPMKPELRPLPMSMCVEYTNANHCPNCGERLLSEYLHCPDCGQAIDWTED